MVKDFNIAKEAGGVGKAIIEKFNVTVNISTLEIRLQWAGKGTTGIPFGSVHGPLISAISVDPGKLYFFVVIFLRLSPLSDLILYMQIQFVIMKQTLHLEKKIEMARLCSLLLQL